MDERDFYGMTVEEAEQALKGEGFCVCVSEVTPDKQRRWDKRLVVGLKRDMNVMTAEIVCCGFLSMPEISANT